MLAILSDDLLDASKIMAFARAEGMIFFWTKNASELCDRVLTEGAQLCVIDLQLSGLDLEKLLHQLRALEHVPVIVGYGSHVQRERLHLARNWGCDLVLPRSAFFEQVKTGIQDWLKLRQADQARIS